LRLHAITSPNCRYDLKFEKENVSEYIPSGIGTGRESGQSTAGLSSSSGDEMAPETLDIAFSCIIDGAENTTKPVIAGERHSGALLPSCLRLLMYLKHPPPYFYPSLTSPEVLAYLLAAMQVENWCHA